MTSISHVLHYRSLLSHRHRNLVHPVTWPMSCFNHGQLDRSTCVDRIRRFEASSFRQSRVIFSRKRVPFPIQLPASKFRRIEHCCSHHAITHRHRYSLLRVPQTSIDSAVGRLIICHPSQHLMMIFSTVIPFRAKVAFGLVSIVSAIMHEKTRWIHRHRPPRPLRTTDQSITRSILKH